MERYIETPECLVRRRRATEEMRKALEGFKKECVDNPAWGNNWDYPLFLTPTEAGEKRTP